MADILIESITPSATETTDRLMVRRGVGPLDHTIELATPATLKGFLGLTTADISGLAAIASSGSAADLSGTKTSAFISDFTEAAQDAVGAMVDTTLVYTDGTPLLSRAALTGAITASAGSNATALGSFTKAQLDAAVSDGNVLYVGDVTTNATHTGDATGATALTLATVNSNVGAFGSATQVATFTVNGTGLTTAAANVAISVPATAISDSTAAGRAMVTAATATAQTALLDTFTSVAKGLAPASGGGTTNFLRADGTWAAPGGGGSITVQDEGINITTALSTLNFVGAGVTVTGGATATVTISGGGGGGLSDGNYGDVTVSGSGTVIRVNPKVKFGLPLAMGRGLQF